MAKHIEVFYPGFVRKAITFSIDDGNLVYDRMMLDIVRPAGIKGTFNLCAPKPEMTNDDYIKMYRGYEISNHTLRHPYVFADGVEYKFGDEVYNPETADPEYVYRHKDDPSMYYFSRGVNRWRLITDADTYIEGIDAGKAALEEIFGEGSVRGFVWPFFDQNNSKVKAYIKSAGYYGARNSGIIGSTTGFALPDDFMEWSCNARHDSLLSVMDEFARYPDDGELKLFAFGVHSADFERENCWDDLRKFATRYGGRADEYWYATVGEIYDYATAVKSLIISDSSIKNPSDTAIYVTINGNRATVDANSEISL